YDPNNNVLSVIDGRGIETRSTYDPLNRRTVVTEAANVAADARTTTTNYDPGDNVQSTIDPRGVTTSYAHDAPNRRTRRTQAHAEPAGMPPLPSPPPTTDTVYDAADNVRKTTGPLQHSTEYTYDKLNRRRTVTNAKGEVTSYDFDTNNLLSVTDGRGVVT